MERDFSLQKCPEKTSVSELLFNGTVRFLAKSYLFLYTISSNPNPIISIVITFYSLILLYLPHLFLSILFSPVLISTIILLATLLRFGSAKRENDKILLPNTQNPDRKHENPNFVKSVTELGFSQKYKDLIFSPDFEENDPKEDFANWVGSEMVFFPDFSETFVEWNRSGPLEVIYEEYEGEDDEDSPEMERRYLGIDGLLCSSFCYSDSDSSEDPSPENLWFMWEEREGLIEIPLGLKSTVGFEVEENLIEINLSVGGK